MGVVDAVFYMGMICVFFQFICSPTLEAVEESVSRADLTLVEIVTKDTYIIHEVNVRQSSPSITDAKRMGMVRLVQNVVDDAVNSSDAAAYPCHTLLCMGKEENNSPLTRTALSVLRLSYLKRLTIFVGRPAAFRISQRGSTLYGEGRNRLPVKQDCAFCVAVEFFEEADYLCG